MLQVVEPTAAPIADLTRRPEGVSDGEPADVFLDAVRTLSAVDRRVVTLTDVKRFSARAVGEVLGIDRAQAQIALMRARRAVRQRLVDTSRVQLALATAQG